jgi:hypothetical protein
MFWSLLLACNNETKVQGDDPTPVPVDTGEYDPYRHDTDHDGYPDAEDCDPDNISINPGATEKCDGIDNDCDGDIDGKDKDTNFDKDDDGYEDITECWRLGGVLDCNDDDPEVNPEADEKCNGYDDNCDGIVDDADEDGDGVLQCEDCDDTDPFVFPGAAEACDGIDNDCSGAADELWDEDGDGYSPCSNDCDEENIDINPGAGDKCDGIDNDCNGYIDDAWDMDRDGYATCLGDCEDGDPSINPGVAEICDGIDNDCEPLTDENIDSDGDGFTVCTGDCNDAAAVALPGGVEVCDSFDNDCNGYWDELQECWSCTQNGSYLLCITSTEWENAAQACEGMATSLAIVDSSGEAAIFDTLTSSQVWIGLHDRELEGDYTWVDGSPMGSYHPWSADEPDGADDKDCIVSNVDGQPGEWGDEDCEERYRFICEL